MTQQILVHNPRPEPVVFRSDGRVLGSFKTSESASDDTVTSRLLSRGRLIDVTPEENTADAVDVGGLTYTADEHTVLPSPSAEEDGEEVLQEPGRNASRAAWFDYALSQGHTREDLDGLTRDQIAALNFPADRGHESDQSTDTEEN